MDRAWMYDFARIDPVYIENVHHFVEEAMRHANREKSMLYCVSVLIVTTKLCGQILKWSNHTDRGLDNMKILEKSSREPLYDESNGCGKEFTQLRVVLELLKLKASHG